MFRKRLISPLGLAVVAAVVVAAVGAAGVGAQGVGPSNFPSPNGLNGWYTYPVISGSFSFFVAGLDGYYKEEDGTFDERLTGITCSGGPNLIYTPFTGPPFIPGSPSIPVQQGVSISGDSASAGVGCTASYERWYYDDCHSFLGIRYCNIEGPWVSAGTRSDFRTFKMDSTPPFNLVVHASSSPNANGWYRSPVTFTVSGQDATSGILNCGIGNFPWTTPSLTVNTNTPSFGAGQGAGCRDQAGNPTGTSVTWKYDNTPPTLAPTVSPSGVLLRGSAATAAANATDTPSGIDAANTGCDPVDTSAAGSFTVSCHATDKAGNTNTAAAAYTVGFGFNGFFSPVENDNVLNKAKAGQAVPLKFTVVDANGPVTNLTSYTLTSNGQSCDLTNPTEAIEANVTGASGLQNLGGGSYQINWKTDKNWSGQCRQVNLTVGGDTTLHSADFHFTK